MIQIKQVHLGLGQFFRGHQALYTQKCNPDWGIAAVSLRTPDAANQMNLQKGKYHVVALDETSVNIDIVNLVQESYFLVESFERVLELLSHEQTEIISFTVTEKGYCFDFNSMKLDQENLELQSDLKLNQKMKTTIGLTASALIKRFETHKKPVTLISCDNVSMNGAVLRCALSEFLEISHPQALSWFNENVTCPNTMVDRIVPKTSAEDKSRFSKYFDFEDNIPIITEKFSQWCIEDKFCSGRPNWENAGAEIVKDIEPYENLKLRALNASHSYLTYAGILKGHTYVHEAVNDPEIHQELVVLLSKEVGWTLSEISNEKFTAYYESLLERFKNQNLKHQLIQIAMDGSQKNSQRWIPTIQDNLKNDKVPEILFKAISFWIIFLIQQTNNNIKIEDPRGEDIARALASNSSSGGVIEKIIELKLIPDNILNNTEFTKVFNEQYRKFL